MCKSLKGSPTWKDVEFLAKNNQLLLSAISHKTDFISSLRTVLGVLSLCVYLMYIFHLGTHIAVNSQKMIFNLCNIDEQE